MKNKVSVVIIARDEEHEIEGCIKSILEANPDELIVVIDDRTQDNTEKIAKAYTDKVYIVKGQRGKLRNYGWEKSRNNIICYVDADMRLPKHYLKDLLPYILEQSQVAMLGAGWLPLGDALCGKLEWIVWDYSKQFGTGGSFYKKEALINVNGFNNNLNTGEDGDLSRRLEKAGWKRVYTTKVRAYHRFPQKWSVLLNKLTHGGTRKFKFKKYLLFFVSPFRAIIMGVRYKSLHILWYYPFRMFVLAFFAGRENYKPIK